MEKSPGVDFPAAACVWGAGEAPGIARQEVGGKTITEKSLPWVFRNQTALGVPRKSLERPDGARPLRS